MYKSTRSSSGLGVNITPDLVNDFFSIKPKGQSVPLKYQKHHVGSSSSMTRGSSGGMTPGNAFNLNDVQYFEQQLKLGSLYDDENEEYDQKVEDINEFLLPEPIDDDEYKSAPQEMSTEVYDNYSFSHVYDNLLPITEEHERIIQTIEANRVTIVEGSTGSGKTTQVPQYILDHYQEKRKFCNILITQPRKIAAITVAKRVSQERNWPIGTLVGYQVARDREVSEDTRITYLTTGVLLQKLIKNKHLNDYTHIILDEVHERDQDVDFAMLVVRYYLKTVSKHVKVVLMSATADCALFSNYFSILINNRKEGAPVISVVGKMYDVEEYYFEDISNLLGPPQQCMYEPAITDECYQFCRELIIALDKDELKQNYEPGKFADNRGTVLCFLPGAPEIKCMDKYLRDITNRCNLKIMHLHSKITNSEQVKVFIPAKKGERKIILSTNIAESSITVSDIKYVIDFCLTKETETDRETKYQRLLLQWASKASLTQRKGRAGRVSDGHCFRLISKHFYDELNEHSIPEMLRAPLEQLILQVKLLDLGPSPSMTLQLALQPPRVSDIKSTILLLKEVGALTIRQNGKINHLDGDITFLGRVLGALPVDVHIGKLLLIGYTFGVLEECLVIGACLSLKSIFSSSFLNDLKTYSNKMRWANDSSCDMLASLNAFKRWKHYKTNVGFGIPEKQWAKKMCVEWKRFREVDELVEDLRKRLLNYNIQTHRNIYMIEEIEKDNELIMKLVIAGAFYPNYFNSQEIDEAEATKTMSGHNPCTTVVVHGAPSTLVNYRSSVAQLFRQCGKGKKLYFENSRTFIEFEKKSGDLPVTPAVLLSLKMRQLRLPLNIHVSKKKDEAFRLMKNTPMESYHPETGLRTNRVNTELEDRDGKISVTCNSKHVKLKDSVYIQLFVQVIISPAHFWATYADHETSKLMHQLNTKINCLGGKNLRVLENEYIVPGAMCLAKYEDEFFRAEIKCVNSANVECFFVDFGNFEIISDRRMIRRCPTELLAYPYQAFECFLSEIRPLHGTWSDEALVRFAKEVPIGTLPLVGKIYSQIHNSYRLDLFSGDISINRLLIEEGYAMHMEEPLASKSRHEEMVNLGEITLDEESPSTYVKDSSHVDQDEEVLKITLRGPFSPYELNFNSITASGRARCTRIERDSVNSVLVCEEPQDKYLRFMVAATITMNPTGSTLNARDTCLLPKIHGLASLLTLLFSPEAELRSDKDQTCLTGALCGLGCDDRGLGILPDHDIEIAFDVKFGNKDLVLINSVRNLINEVIGIDLEKIEYAPKKIAFIQECARSKLMELIDTRREDMEPVLFKNELRWKQVDEASIITSGCIENPTHLYVYHKKIFLNEKKDTIDPRFVEQWKLLKKFHAQVGTSTVPFTSEVICPVCEVICRHPHGLQCHCETQAHKSWAQAIHKEVMKHEEI